MKSLILVCSVMLWASVGWAETLEEYFYQDREIGVQRLYAIKDADGNMLLECDQRHCTGLLIEQNVCYQKMREAIQHMKAQMQPNSNSRSLTRGFVMTEEAWTKNFEPLYQECVQ